jgi:predicted dehydrogenase
MSLQIGLIGAGRLGTYHARCLSAVENAELTGIYDLQPLRAESLAKETGSKAFDGLSELLNQVDGVVIASDTQTHFDIGMQAVDQGCHVFVEKPITATGACISQRSSGKKIKDSSGSCGTIQSRFP